MLILDLIKGRVFLPIVLYLAICTSSALAQPLDKTRLTESSLITNFVMPIPIGQSASLPTLLFDYRQNFASIFSPFYPLLQNDLSSLDFEQVQSIIIPGGIVDTINKIVYLENGSNNIVKLDLASGTTIRRINDACVPIAVIDNCLLALSKTRKEAKFSYSLVMLSNNLSNYKMRWSPILLPDWLDLPADGERQKFVFSNHGHNGILSTTWQASKQMMFPDALSWLAPYMSGPSAFQGHFSCQLNSQTIVSQSIEESNDDFMAYLSVNENSLPNQVSINADNVAINTYDNYLFSLVRVYPPEHNISKAGVVGKRELQVTDLNTGKILWTHTLPATFTPLSF
jgi:hypothetical protein